MRNEKYYTSTPIKITPAAHKQLIHSMTQMESLRTKSGMVAIWVFCATLLNESASFEMVPSNTAPALSHRQLSAADCSVEWLGTDDVTTFEVNLQLLSNIPNEHDTLAGTSCRLPCIE